MSGFKQDYLLPVLVLTIICLISSGALAVTHQITMPIIEEAERNEAVAARMEVLPAADSFEQVQAQFPGIEEAFIAQNGSGFVIVASGKGYAGEIKLIMGIDNNGQIHRVKVLSHTETAGLGSKAAEEAHLGGFAGKSEKFYDVQAVSGATVSSKSIADIIEQAYTCYENIK
jgi:electron transport complex protein RnfG